MPAQFPQSIRDALTAVNSTTGGATSFASRLVTLINAAFGTSNPFGTAATRDAGTAAGDLPVLGADGLIDSGQLRQAHGRTEPGTVTIANSISNTEAPGSVVSPSVARSVVGTLTQGITASDFAVIDLRPTAVGGGATGLYETPGSGFLIASSGGQGGANSLGTAGANGRPFVVQYGVANADDFTGTSPSLTAAGFPNAFQILNIFPLAIAAGTAPSWAFVRGGAGAQGGNSGFSATATPQPRGRNGDLLIAYFEGAGKHIRITNVGEGGNGAAAGAGVAGQKGGDGGAIFIRID